MTDYDRGPLLAWEVVWRDGRTETVWAHQCLTPNILSVHGGTAPRVQFHGEVDGRWNLILAADDEEIVAVRNVAAAPAPRVSWWRRLKFRVYHSAFGVAPW